MNKEIKRFGTTETMMEILLPFEVKQLTDIINNIVGIANDNSISEDEKVSKCHDIYESFFRIYHAYAPGTWENIQVSDMDSSEISENRAEYLPFTYIRCVYSVFDNILFSDISDVDWGSIEGYFNDLDAIITYRLE